MSYINNCANKLATVFTDPFSNSLKLILFDSTTAIRPVIIRRPKIVLYVLLNLYCLR